MLISENARSEGRERKRERKKIGKKKNDFCVSLCVYVCVCLLRLLRVYTESKSDEEEEGYVCTSCALRQEV